MDKDTIKGKLKDAEGRVQRQAGEWLEDEEVEAKGLKNQVKGKIQESVGKAKDAARDVRQRFEDKDKNRKKDEAA